MINFNFLTIYSAHIGNTNVLNFTFVRLFFPRIISSYIYLGQNKNLGITGR